jgi:hypothetical protein
MAKNAPDAQQEAALTYIASATRVCVCSAEPTTYTEAITTFMLAFTAMTAGIGGADYTAAAGSPSGRKLTMTAKSGIAITNGGTATHVALVSTGDTTLRAVTTCTSQVLTAGGTVDIPSWTWTTQDPA